MTMNQTVLLGLSLWLLLLGFWTARVSKNASIGKDSPAAASFLQQLFMFSALAATVFGIVVILK